jgi:hypothetical protein
MEISERLDSDQVEAMLKRRNPVEFMLYLYSKFEQTGCRGTLMLTMLPTKSVRR